MVLLNKSNISPNKWGPIFWETFHLSTAGYPENPTNEHINSYREFYISFMKILPCNRCSKEAQEMINANIFDLNKGLQSRSNLLYWGYEFHDAVNKKLNKQSISFNEFIERYSKGNSTKEFRTSDSEEITNSFPFAILVFVVIVLIGIFIKHYT